MSLSRRMLLLSGPLAALGCVTLSRHTASEAGDEVRFGRHSLRVPDELRSGERVSFELGTLQGFEHSNAKETRALLDRLEQEAQYVLATEPRPNFTISRVAFVHQGATFDIIEYDLGPTAEALYEVKIVVDAGARPLVIHGPLRGADLREAEANARALISAIAPLPAPAHEHPFCSSSYSIDVAPALGQGIELSMESDDGRVLVAEAAYVRAREHRELGAPSFARDSLAYARSRRTGPGVGNLHLRRRTVRVAGVVAPEVVWTTNEGRGGLLHFAWIHLGVAHDPWRPFLSVYFSGDLASASRRELDEQWTALLGSLRPLSK
ncbi:MAG: hypothetical protein R6X02_04850 [Enhygromyxa sp.]